MEVWRKLRNEKLRDWYSTPNIIRMIKSRRMMGRLCGTNVGEEDRVCVISKKARGKETTRKTKT
jgi:hypothetical protein